MPLFIQSTNRMNLRVEETQFLGVADEAALYCREMAVHFPNLVFKVVNRPAVRVPSLGAAARETMAAIEAHFTRYA